MFFDEVYRCPYCGEPISNRVACKECAEKLSDFVNFKKMKTAYCNEIVAPFIYDGLVRGAVLDYKFGGKVDNCESFAFFMKNCDLAKADLVVGVPCFKNRQKAKVAKNLTLAFSRATRLKCSFLAVKKVKKTHFQHESGLSQRRTNLRGAFEVRSRKIKNKKILICDDIITSGSTVNELAYVLKEAGAVKVSAVAVAISKIILARGLAELV